ncbi:hypothetical protein GKE82_23805 [Conexibacter sp. W3-3-2]|uniref:hypothetical protein n=1 Tax=Conexibacter sp. W3-3-2 TaxID=2675227 RepID=UPI0012B8D357|nr:hypothetical protein [Conexibacter sp. W3-3-2]MTD47232.1 hypothetical protein [Conexibacter sp. W3-3-2]
MSFSEAHYPGRPQEPIPALEVAERDLEHLALLGLRARARHRVQRALAPHLTELARTAGWWAALDVQIASTLLDGILAGPRALIVVETRGRDWSLDDLAVAQSKAALLYDSLSTYVQPIYAVVVLTERDDAPRLWTDDDGASAFVMGASWLTHWATAEHRGGIPAHQTRHLNALGTLDQAHALLERDRRHRELRAR